MLFRSVSQSRYDKVDSMAKQINDKADSMAKQLNVTNDKVDSMAKQMDTMNKRMNTLENRMPGLDKGLTNRMDQVNSRIVETSLYLTNQINSLSYELRVQLNKHESYLMQIDSVFPQIQHEINDKLYILEANLIDQINNQTSNGDLS